MITSKYCEIIVPNGFSGTVKVNTSFTNPPGLLAEHAALQVYTIDKNGAHYISYKKTSLNGTCNVEIPDVGGDISKVYLVFSNVAYACTIDFTARISLAQHSDSISFFSSMRYFEKMNYIPQGEDVNYTVTFETPGIKTFQTFGDVDTYIELYTLSGERLKSNDDSGYGLNGLISYEVSAYTTYKVKVRCYGTNFGITKLVIVPVFGVSDYNDIDFISGNTLTDYAQQYYTKMIKYVTHFNCSYIFELESDLDNYIYVIDPRTSDIIVNDVDYNDDGGSDDTDARLIKRLEAYVPYLIIYTPFNPNNSCNGSESDRIKLKIAQNTAPIVTYTPDSLNYEIVSRSGSSWDIKIINPNHYPVQVSYNSKMCTESSAKNFSGLDSIVTINIMGDSSQTVKIEKNDLGWITMCIDCHYISAVMGRIITFTNGSSKTLTSNILDLLCSI